MIKSNQSVGGKDTIVYEFSSIHEFLEYIDKTPRSNFAKSFGMNESTATHSDGWAGTKNIEEALNLMLNGWTIMAEKLEAKLKLIAQEVQQKTIRKAQYDVAGFQASVPRMIMGIPQSMINQKTVAMKQKVITINKDIYYSARYSAQQIEENSIKALQIVKKIEAQGYRVNFNIVMGASSNDNGSGERFIFKVKIKDASERLNISKVAFALVHPSMSRRLGFKMMETMEDGFKGSAWSAYGYPLGNNGKKAIEMKNEIALGRDIYDIDNEIASMNLQ